MKASEFIIEAKATKTRLDPKCWSGKKIGTPKTKVKGGVRVNNCVPAESVELDEISRRDFLKGAGATAGLAAMGAPKDANADWINRGTTKDPFDDTEFNKWDNASTDRSATLELQNQKYGGQQNWHPMLLLKSNTGSWRPFRPEGHRGPISNMSGRIRLGNGPVTSVHLGFVEGNNWTVLLVSPEGGSISDRNFIQAVASADRVRIQLPARQGDRYDQEVLEFRKSQNESIAEEELNEEFDLIESNIDMLAERNGVDAEVIWEDLESLTDDELYVFAATQPVMEDWQKANKKDRTAGMSQKAVNAYRREHPGSKLKTAVTTKPSKLKKGSKASKRRKSYCSRSRGQMKMHNISCAKTPDKAICAARRRWNCE